MKNLINKIFMIFHKLNYRLLSFKAYYYSCIFKSCGEHLKLWGECYIKNPQNISLGNNNSINDGVYLNGLGGIVTGNNVAISAGAIVVSTLIKPSEVSSERRHLNKQITIGNNVQIGAGAIVLAGVNIGNNVIIGAGAVVTKNVPNNMIMIGNPARVLREV